MDGADEGRAWCVPPYRGGDEVAAVALWERVFGRPLSLAHYRWKVLASPWQGAVPTVWYADAGPGGLVGQYAGTVMRFKLGDAERRVLHSCDAMTDPAFRRQGVLSAVGSAATEAWGRREIAFVIGLPHSGWGTRRAFLGWRTLFHARWWRRTLSPAPALAAKGWPALAIRLPAALLGLWNRWHDQRQGRRAAGVMVRAVERVDERFDALWQSVAGAYESLVVRDAAWLRYRYEEAPDRRYTILLAERAGAPVGYLVLWLQEEGRRRTGFLVDLLAAPEDESTWAALLQAAVRWAERAGASTLRALVPEGGLLARAVRGAAFRPAHGRYDVSAVALRGESLPPEIESPRRWYVTAGDFDIL